METMLLDLRFALRMLWKNPGFTAGALLTLTLGMGANTAIFSVVNAVLLRPLPYADPVRLVSISESNPEQGIRDDYVSEATLIDWRYQNRSFVDLAAVSGFLPDLAAGGEPERVLAAAVTSNYFSLLGVKPQIGRTFFANEGASGGARVVVLSNACWKRRFGGSPDVLGSTVNLSGVPYEVVGVMSPDFRNARHDDFIPVELWKPISLEPNAARRRGSVLSVIARLRPGISIEQAQIDLNVIESNLEQQYPDTNSGWRAAVVSLHERFTGNIRSSLYVLVAAASFLLLLACANVVNLLLVRVLARQKEIAIRLALGATRGRLARQVITESLLLSLAGGTLGVLLSWWVVKLVVPVGPRDLPRLDGIQTDFTVLAFTLIIITATGLVCSVLPVMQSSRPGLIEALKKGGVANGGGSRRLRDALAAAEIALALILLIGAGLMVKSFIRLQNVELGFNPNRLLTGMLALSPRRYRGDGQVVVFYREVVSRLESLPGIESAAAISEPPVPGEKLLVKLEIEGRPFSPDEKRPDADSHTVTPGYFRVARIPLLHGRWFDESDGEQAAPLVIVSETMAWQYFPGEDAVGKRVKVAGRSDAAWLTITGIVGDVRNDRLDSPTYPEVYFPYTQRPVRSMFLIARTAGSPLRELPAVKGVIKEMDSALTLYNVNSIDGMLADAISRPRFNTLLITIFAVVAITLAAVGIYSVVSYASALRTHEIGVRMALGASRRAVLGLILGHGARVALCGIGVGLGGACAVTRLLSSLLFAVPATDALTFAAASALLFFAASLASFAPANRASQVDPVIALRYE